MCPQSTPEVSVVLPVYNNASTIERSIDSIRKQTVQDIEIIVIDDGSTDDTCSIVREVEKKDPRVQVLANEWNRGLPYTLNLGLERCIAPYVARQDADDVSAPDRLRIQSEFLEEQELCSVVGSAAWVSHSTSGQVKYYDYSHLDGLYPLCMWLGLGSFPHTSAMFRRSLATKVGGYRRVLRRKQDVDLWLRLSRFGRVRIIEQPLVFVEKSETSLSQQATGVGFEKGTYAVASRAMGLISRRNPDFSWPETEEGAEALMREVESFLDGTGYLWCRADGDGWSGSEGGPEGGWWRTVRRLGARTLFPVWLLGSQVLMRAKS